jgi:hypothetical protein
MLPTAGAIDHDTAWFVELSTVAVNCCVSPACSVTAEGVAWTATAGIRATVAATLFVVSAMLVAVTVTVCCAATVAGAVYRPLGVIVPAPAGLIDQETAVFDEYATVTENCWVCAACSETLGGARVTATGSSVAVAVADRVVSATLVALTLIVCGVKLTGAVYSPAVEIVPTAGVIDHVTAVFETFVTVAENCCVCDAPSEIAGGATVTPADPASVTVAVAVLLVSAALVAFTVTVCAAALDGAVYSPVFVIVPTAGVIDHVTAVFEEFTTVAVNCCDCEGESVAAKGLTLTDTPAAAKLSLPTKAL